jgi:hypothetical protein
VSIFGIDPCGELASKLIPLVFAIWLVVALCKSVGVPIKVGRILCVGENKAISHQKASGETNWRSDSPSVGMDEITKEWFSNARERYGGAVRFGFVLLALLLGIQLTTFTEYLDKQVRLRRAKTQAEEARTLAAAINEVAAAANTLQQTVTDNLQGLLNRLVEDLKSDFAALDAKVADLQGNRSIPSKPRTNPAIQQLNAPGLFKREIDLGNDLETKIREASSIAQVSLLLTAWIDENIIRRRFSEVADGWKQSQNAILEKADALNDTLGKLPSATAETNTGFAQQIAQLRTSLSTFPARLSAVAFRPPANPTWWQSVHGKGETTQLLEEDALKALQTGSANDAAAQLAEAASKTQRETEAVQKVLQEQLDALEKNFEEQKQEADSLAKPFAFIALSLDFVAKRFPALIGCGLATAIAWPAYRRRELASALRLLEPEPGEMCGALGLAWSPSNRPLVTLRWLLAGSFAAVWVGITGWQLVTASVLTPIEAGIQTLWGLLPIVAATWYAYSIDRKLRTVPPHSPC